MLTQKLLDYQNRMNLNNDYTNVLNWLQDKNIFKTSGEALKNRKRIGKIRSKSITINY
jgi:hypothetical protein